MSEEIRFRDDLKIIEVPICESATIEEIYGYIDVVKGLIHKHKVNDVLIDIRKQKRSMGIFDLFEFTVNLPRELKYAIVFSAKTKGEQNFVETVAINRGYSIKTFECDKEAVRWLKE